LQEAAEADLLLHVVDASSPALAEQQAEVERVLAEIGAAELPQVLVYNKLDQVPAGQRPRAMVDWVERPSGVRVPRVWVSARDGTGLDVLRDCIAQLASGAGMAEPATQHDNIAPGARSDDHELPQSDDNHPRPLQA
jgi:GTP-binding protein HflX